MGSPECGIPVRPSVVDRVYNLVEWDLVPDPPGATASSGDGVGCLRLGLRGMAWLTVVRSTMGIQCLGPGHFVQGTYSDNTGSSHMGPALERSPHDLSLRQPGSGSLPALTLEPPAESDAPHSLSCIRM